MTIAATVLDALGLGAESMVRTRRLDVALRDAGPKDGKAVLLLPG